MTTPADSLLPTSIDTAAAPLDETALPGRGRLVWRRLIRQKQGLLGLAFARDYATSGLFYVDYTIGNNDIRVAQFKRSAGDPDVADASSGRTVITIGHPGQSNHNGGQLAFGPEGLLYVGVGDGGNEGDPEGHGQNTDTLLGSPYALLGDKAQMIDTLLERRERWALTYFTCWEEDVDRFAPVVASLSTQ